MSQHLKQHAPLASLGFERVAPSSESAQDIKDRGLAQMGWKMQGLQSAADSLLSSATRLESEIAQETRYWEDILDFDCQRWSLFRMPREKHTLGVNFGFLEGD